MAIYRSLLKGGSWLREIHGCYRLVSLSGVPLASLSLRRSLIVTFAPGSHRASHQVGATRDVKQFDLEKDILPQTYESYLHYKSFSELRIVLRGKSSPEKT